eukprot:526803_1
MSTFLIAILGFFFHILQAEPIWQRTIIDNLDDINHLSEFNDWKNTFNKQYQDIKEESHRFLVWLDNWYEINEHNMNSGSSFTMGLNQFSDMTFDEFKLYVHGHNESCLTKNENKNDNSVQITADIEAPDAIDWTNISGKSYVTPVKDQKSCGSCWAFSTTGSIESQSAIALGVTDANITMLSEQELIDCSHLEGNLGCMGGQMDHAFKYVERAGGLCSESEYPYKAWSDPVCREDKCATKYYPIKSYTDVQHDSTDSLKTAVAAGPVSIAVDASGSSWQHYKSGVMDDKCGTRLDHGVLAVGYGLDTKSGEEYWKVKNSWGTSWGMDGYLLICRECGQNGDKGECGILMQPSFPVVK